MFLRMEKIKLRQFKEIEGFQGTSIMRLPLYKVRGVNKKEINNKNKRKKYDASDAGSEVI